MQAAGSIGRVHSQRFILSPKSALAVVAVLFAVQALAAKGQLAWAKWQPFTLSTTWTTYILPGVVGTLTAAGLAIVAAFAVGAGLGLARLSDHRPIRVAAGAVVEVFRAVPLLILMIFAYQLFADWGIASKYLPLSAVVVSLTLYNGAVFSDIVRSGVLSLPRGQREASTALGLRKTQTMLIILLPQAITAMLPALISQMVVILKDSALGYLIGYVEVVRSGQQVGAFYGNYLPSLIVVGLIMIALNATLSAAAARVEKRIRLGRSRSAPQPGPPVSVSPLPGDKALAKA
jgi:glutamate transport system permease protein